MSLFNDMTVISHQHPESGSYTFINPIEPDKPEIDIRVEPEPAPTVSLYNLLDHSEEDIDIAIKAFQDYEAFMLRDGKMKYPKAYPTTIAWIRIFQQAKSEAWAEKTAKEILGNDNCGPEHNV